MARQITTEKFIEKARKVHGDEYAYDNVVYTDTNTPITIKCCIHGEFQQKPKNHLAGKGCPICGKEKRRKNLSLGLEGFLIRAREVHGDDYIYDDVVYVNNQTPVNIICRKHGKFSQVPINHLQGCGCPACAGNKPLDTETFIERSRKVHGDYYDYNKSEYVNGQTKICIICPKHGEFWQTSDSHLHGHGCPKCVSEGRFWGTEKFIGRARKVHGDKYDYTKTNHIDNNTDIIVTCPVHGDFRISPREHLKGRGCPKCTQEIKEKRLIGFKESFLENARKVHRNVYIYDYVDYVNADTKVCIICPIHGEFWQTPSSHLQGMGCPKCGDLRKAEKLSNTLEDFTREATRVHKGKYIYTDSKYVNYATLINITCPIHGIFWQRPYDHISGHGCPKCACSISNSEVELHDFIENLLGKENVIYNNRKFLNGLETDILIPSHNLAIEYNGLYWHSEERGKDKSYHLNKTELAESKGYHLIHIFEDEWLEHKDIVLNKIRHFLGKDTGKPVVGARKCTIKKVSKAEVEPFLNTYHIQGYVPSTAYYGAFYEDKLVGIMAFKQEKPNEWNLTRFATNTSYRLPGLASKIFKQFIKDNNPIEVKTFLDRRWSHGDVNVYDKMGFKLVETLSPDYRYVVEKQRLHKFGYRKQILHKKYGLPLTMTEREMTEKLGFYRIWDCGLYKYVWKP